MNIKTNPWRGFFKRPSLVLAAGFALVVGRTGHAQTLLLDLAAKNYNTATGVWSDPTTGNSATGPAGVLVANSTPNGSSAVSLNGSQTFALTTTIPLNTGTTAYTIFAFANPTAAPNGSGALISGGNGSLEYRINGDLTQGTVRTSQAYLGSSTTALTLNTYANINVTVASGGGTYRLNGSASGATTGDGGITNPLTNIGSQDNGSEKFTGNIAEIEVFSGAMTDAQRAAVEQQFAASYVNTVPEPDTGFMALVGTGMFLSYRCLRTRKA